MTFFQEMRNIVLGHGAINNSYLDRFQSGDLTDADLGEFATEFYNFARFFPQYRDFLRSIGIEVHWAMSRPMLPSTRAYIEGMEQLYRDGNHAKALGASFGLENMAITMWDHLIPGLASLKTSRYPHMDITYFTFHRQLESTHEEAMEHAVAAVESRTNVGMSDQDKNDFRCGVNAVLGYLEAFWMGLERRGSPDREPHAIHHHAA